MPNPVDTAFMDIQNTQAPSARVGVKESLIDAIPLMLGGAADAFAGDDIATKTIALMQRRKQDATQLQFANMIDLKTLQLNAAMKKLESELAVADDARRALESSSRIKENEANTGAAKALEAARISETTLGEGREPFIRDEITSRTQENRARSEKLSIEASELRAAQPFNIVKLIEETKRKVAETEETTEKVKLVKGQTRKVEAEADQEEMELERKINISNFVAQHIHSDDPTKRAMAESLYFDQKLPDKSNPVDIIKQLRSTNPVISEIMSIPEGQWTPADRKRLGKEVEIEMSTAGNGKAVLKPILSTLNGIITGMPEDSVDDKGRLKPDAKKALAQQTAETIGPHYKELKKFLGRDELRKTVLDDIAKMVGMTTTKLEQLIVEAGMEYHKLKDEGKFLEKELGPIINRHPFVPLGSGGPSSNTGYGNLPPKPTSPAYKGPTKANWNKAMEKPFVYEGKKK